MAIKFLSGLNLSNVTAGSILKLDSNGNIVSATAGTDYVSSSTWSTASNSNIYYNSGGVRIGTYQSSVDAAAQLHVFDYQTTDPKLLIEDGNTGDASMQFKISTQQYTMGIDNSDSDIFKISAGNSFTTSDFEMDSGGKVGIKTTPSYTLDVYSATTNVVSRFKSGDNQAWISIQDDDSGTYGVLLGTDSDNSQTFIVADSNANKKIVLKGDKLGVLTSDPDAHLHVVSAGDNGSAGLSEYGFVVTSNSTNQPTLGAESIGDGYANLNLGSNISGTRTFWHISKRKSTDSHQLEYYYYNGTGFDSKFTFRTDGSFLANELDLPSGGQLDWANGDARIIEGLVSNYSLSFQTYTGSALTTKMFVSSGGNVGIGTTSPDRQLQVHESTSGTSTAKFTNSTTGEDGDTGFFVGINGSEQPILFGYNSTDMVIGTDGTERMRITSAGNVGIGTTSPSHKLEVNGTSKFVGNQTHLRPILSRDYGNEMLGIDRVGTDTYSSNINIGYNVYRTGDSYATFSDGNDAVFTIEDITISSTSNVYARELIVYMHGSFSGNFKIEVKKSDGTWVTAINQTSVTLGGGDWHRFSPSWSSVAPYPAAWSLKGLRFTFSNYTSGTNVYVGQIGITNTQHSNTMPYYNKADGYGYGNLTLKTSTDSAVSHGIIVERSNNGDKGYINYQGGGFQFRATDGDPIVFGTVSNERVRILDSGYVGIGTTIPQAKLEVMVPRVTDGSRQEIQRFSHLNENSLSVFAYGGSTDLIQIGAWNAEQNIAIVTEALSSMTATTAKGIYIKSGGNVGIGTTSPGSKLSVRATTATHQLVSINRANSDTAALYLGNNSSNDAIISGNNAPISLGKDVSGTYTEYVNIATDGELKFSAYGAGILKTNASGIVSLDTNTYLTSVSVDWSDIASINGTININSTTQIGQGDTETLVSFQNSGTERARFEVDDSANSYFVATGFKTSTASTGFLKADGTVDTGDFFGGAYSDLTGTPTLGTMAAANTSDYKDSDTVESYVAQELTGYATETYVGTQISNLVDSSPAALDTLNELAAALGDDASFSTTVTTSIATKLPLAGGTLTGKLKIDTRLQIGDDTSSSNDYIYDGYLDANSAYFHQPKVIIRSDSSATGGLDEAPVALSMFNRNGTNDTWVKMSFASREVNGSGNTVSIAGIAAQKTTGTANSWASGKLYLWTKNGASFVENMVLQPNGNVGVGTSSPGYKLDVAGTIRSGTGYRTSINGDSSGAVVLFGSASDNDSLGVIGAYASKFNISSGNGDMSFQFNSTERMLLAGNGDLKLNSYGAGILKTDANGNVSLDTNTYLTSIPSEYLTETEGDARYVSYESLGRAVPAAGGWYRLAKLSRGGARFAISYTGGNMSPHTYIIDAFKNWNNEATISVEKFGHANYITGFRISRRTGEGNNDYYLEANFTNLSNTHSFEARYQEVLGYTSISEIYSVSSSSTLVASNSDNSERIEEVTTTTAEGLYLQNINLSGRLNLYTDSNTTSTTALVLNGTEVEKRTLGSNAFSSTSFLPLAGGTMTGNINLGDNNKVILGTGSDFEMFHNGSNTYLQTTTSSVGDFYITARGTNHDLYLEAADDIFIRPQGNESGIDVIGNGAVKLYYDGAMKLETTDDGINVPGVAQLGATNFYFHDVGVGDADGLDIKWTLKNPNGNDVTSTEGATVYRLRLVTLGTGTNTGAVYICDNVDGAGWRAKKVSSVDSGSPNSNYPFVEIDGGVPKVTIQHNSTYNVRVIIEAFYGGNGGASYEMLGLDSGITNENGSVLMSLGSTTTEATSVMINSSGVLQKRDLGSLAFNSTTLGTAASSAATDFVAVSGDTMTGDLLISNNNLTGLKLTGSNGSYTSAVIANTGSGAATIWFDASNGDLAGSDYAWIRQNNDLNFEIGVDSSGGDMLFTEGGSERMRISSGNVGIGTANPDAKLDVVGNIASTDQISVNNRTAISVGHWSASGSTTGAIRITIPGSHSSNWSMLVLRITAYEYNSTAHTIYYVSGHDWTSGWYNNGVTKIGNGNKDIKLGYDSSKDYVLLGGVSDTWSYGHVTVDVMAHPSFYSSNMDITSGWDVRQTTDISGITTQTVTNKRVLTTSDEGSGNGIDADTVDGLQASSFLRSDANDTASGIVTFTNNAAEPLAPVHITGGGNHTGLYINPAASKQAHVRFATNGTLKWQIRAPFQDSANTALKFYSWVNSADQFVFNHNGDYTAAGVIKGYGSVRVDAAATGDPYFGLYQAGSEKAYIQYVDTGDNLVVQSDGKVTIRGDVQYGQGDEDAVISFKQSTSELAKIDQDGYIYATGFKTSTASTGFLKADGSVDTSTYASSTHNHDSDYVSILGGYYDEDFAWDGTHDFQNEIKVSGASATTTNTTALFYGASGLVEKRGLGTAAFSATGDFAAASHTHSYLPLAGGTLTGDLLIDTGTTGSTTQAYSAFDSLQFNNQYSSVAAGPNKIVMYDDGGSWVGGFGIHDDTTAYYSGGTHKWYKTATGPGGPTFTQKMSLDASGNLVTTGTLTSTGATLSGALTLSSGDLFVPGYIRHYGDNDTYVLFTNNRVQIAAGGTVKFDSNNTYLTSETDTFASVTGRGASTTTSLSIRNLTSRTILPEADKTYNLGAEETRWAIVYCETLDSAGQHESQLQNPEGEKSIGDYATGTVLVWKGGKNIPCTEAADHMRMGIAVNGIDSPLVQGAEPVLVTGSVNEGDYLVTSSVEGHAKAITPQFMRQHMLFDCVIGKALKSGEGDSHLIKTWINI